MSYSLGDRVIITRCPNPDFIGLVGIIAAARVNGTYNVETDALGKYRQILVYSTEIRPVMPQDITFSS